MTNYDNLYKDGRAIFGEKPLPLVEHILNYKTSGTVLDIGSGYGRNSLFLAQKGFAVTAIDTSGVAIENLLKSAADLELPITAKIEKAENVELGTPYDVVLAMFVLHHVPDKMARKLISCLQEHTPLSGIHTIAAFTNDSDFYREKPKRKDFFYPKPGELKDLYAGWEILVWEEKETKATQKNDTGTQMRNLTSFLLASKN